jgi:DNA ligase-1
MSKFKPMLAADADLSKLRFPLLVSPKLDGVRATSLEGKLVSRSLKAFPNPMVEAKLASIAPLDGELICGDPNSPTVFRDTMKCVMSHVFPVDELRWFVFDLVQSTRRFEERLKDASNYCDGKQIVHLPHRLITTIDELTEAEEQALAAGFEGVMVRDPNGRYKFGRATVSEGSLLKVKRFLQAEAQIIGFEEQMHNANEAKTNALGNTERSSHKANMVPLGVLGAFVVRSPEGVEFNIGTGFTADDRYQFWRNRHELIGSVVTYKYLPIGVKDKPRHPVFLGFRPEGV